MDATVSIELFVEILNRYVYYFDQENEAVRNLFHIFPFVSVFSRTNRGCADQVTTKYINGLIELIHSNLSSNDSTASAAAMDGPKRHFQRTLDYIASRGYEGVVTQAKT